MSPVCYGNCVLGNVAMDIFILKKSNISESESEVFVAPIKYT